MESFIPKSLSKNLGAGALRIQCRSLGPETLEPNPIFGLKLVHHPLSLTRGSVTPVSLGSELGGVNPKHSNLLEL